MEKYILKQYKILFGVLGLSFKECSHMSIQVCIHISMNVGARGRLEGSSSIVPHIIFMMWYLM